MGREQKGGRKRVGEGNFFPLPHPLPSTFLLSPHFSRGPNDSFARPEFRSLRTGTLATQARNLRQLMSVRKFRIYSCKMNTFSHYKIVRKLRWRCWFLYLVSGWRTCANCLVVSSASSVTFPKAPVNAQLPCDQASLFFSRPEEKKMEA